jgi:nicotinate-nucleotide adenylyltransferase
VRLGILGGSFDPPHIGHLLAAVDAYDGLRLDRLLFVPAAAQPLKVGVVAAPPADRLAMVRLLAGEDPRFAVDPIEIEREGLSYTVDTLAAFAERFPDAERFFLVGSLSRAPQDYELGQPQHPLGLAPHAEGSHHVGPDEKEPLRVREPLRERRQRVNRVR